MNDGVFLTKDEMEKKLNDENIKNYFIDVA